MKKVHFIAVGGAVMHNLAIALHKKGYRVTGSDDEIFEPSRSRLAAHELLPSEQGWDENKITPDLDAVVLGMHAHADNPELQKARQLELKIYSVPEYLYEQTRDKKRIVVGGSHGKTTTTSMIMHVLRENGFAFDYMVGAQVEGFHTMVGLTDAPIAVFEGDEYLSSSLDPRPKFHLYHPHIAILTGIAWDHINVFPTFENYLEQFSKFIGMIEPGGNLVYFEGDDHLSGLASKAGNNIEKQTYTTHPHAVENGRTFLINGDMKYPCLVFGEHNLQNISAAKAVCLMSGVTEEGFYRAISSFSGASKRLQLLAESKSTSVFLDFAHSPSKLKATTRAVRAQFPGRKLVACMELHTFSSLKKEFLPQYAGTMKDADKAFVYYSPETVKHKRLEEITPAQVAAAFGGDNVSVFTDPEELARQLKTIDWKNASLLLMSSGNFSGIEFKSFAGEIIALAGE
ncbi:MAG: Mur ligase family protein [Bacteroidota bacterium]